MLRAATTFAGAGVFLFTSAAPGHAAPPRAAATPAETRTAQAFEKARTQGPLALHAFLVGMPKGGDLHMHLSGAIYAETFLDEAAEDGLCIDPAALAVDRTAPRGACKPGGGERSRRAPA